MKMKIKKYDVAIIGSGPAGMSAALELIKLKSNLKIVILEKGPIRKQGDRKNRELVTVGWGGAGTFSDGKLCLTAKVGGHLAGILGEEEDINELIKYVDKQYLAFGGDKGNKIPLDLVAAHKLKIEAFGAGFKDFIYYETRHWGTDNAYFICDNIRQHLADKGVDILCDMKISGIEKNKKFLLIGENDYCFEADIVVLAMGRSGNEQMGKIAKNYGLKISDNGVDIGLRLETRAEAFEKFTKVVQDPKLILETSKGEVRTFCVCPYGFVRLESNEDVLTVNGESYSNNSGVKSLNTNFAILVHRQFTEPFNDPLEYGRIIAMLANKLGKTVLVQSLSDFLRNRRSTKERIKRSGVSSTLKEAEPGSIGSAIPYDFMVPLIAMIEALMKVAPINPDILLMYAAEVKNYAVRIETIGTSFETKEKGLYVAGDGSGYTRGIMQASMQGILVARDIVGIFK